MGRMIGVCALILAAVIGLAIWADSNTANSTQGVTVIGDNMARLPQGEDFVLTYTTYCGKGCTNVHVWHITYDGENTVNFQEEGWWIFDGDHVVGKLCGIDCTADVGMDWPDKMHITLRADRTVSVKWPWGWNYREYRA